MKKRESTEISEKTGVDNDFRGNPGKRQVTVISKDVWTKVCEELGEELPWTTRRANLLVEGLDLPKRIGDIIEIGVVRLNVMMETAPCSRMEDACSGLKKALGPEWRGGVACEVHVGGTVAIGDTVSVRRKSLSNSTSR